MPSKAYKQREREAVRVGSSHTRAEQKKKKTPRIVTRTPIIVQYHPSNIAAVAFALVVTFYGQFSPMLQ